MEVVSKLLFLGLLLVLTLVNSVTVVAGEREPTLESRQVKEELLISQNDRDHTPHRLEPLWSLAQYVYDSVQHYSQPDKSQGDFNDLQDESTLGVNYLDNIRFNLIQLLCSDNSDRVSPDDGHATDGVRLACLFFPQEASFQKHKSSSINTQPPASEKLSSHIGNWSNNISSNAGNSMRSPRSADGGYGHQPVENVYPHLYPYKDDAGLQYLQNKDNSLYYTHVDQSYHSDYSEKKPPRYVEVYPGAYQAEYSYSKIPRTYWMFHALKGLFTIWEVLQTLAILYLLWKVTVLKFLPGREGDSTDLLSWGWSTLVEALGLPPATVSREHPTAGDGVNIGSIESTHHNTNLRTTDGEEIKEFVLKNEDVQKSIVEETIGLPNFPDNDNRSERSYSMEPGSSKTIRGTSSQFNQNSNSDLIDFITAMKSEWEDYIRKDCIDCSPAHVIKSSGVARGNTIQLIESLMEYFLGSSAAGGTVSELLPA